jgi:hypothetical protein
MGIGHVGPSRAGLGRASAGLLLLLACSSSDPATPSNKDAGGGGDAGSSAGTGALTVELVEPTPATADTAAVPGSIDVRGRFYGGPVPSPFGWNKTGEEGGCKLYEPKELFCNPACAVGSTCVGDNRCEVDPDPVSVGTVRLKGVKTVAGASEITLAADAPAYFYHPKLEDTFPYPTAFSEGAAIEVTASGDKLPAFTVKGKGIRPLEVASTAPIPIDKGKPLALQWVASTDSTVATIEVLVDLSHHGGIKGKIECQTSDTGSFSIPAALVTRLIELGVAGFPVVRLDRRAVATTSVGTGRVELVVFSEIEHELTLPGLVSCTKDEDCQSPQTCQPALFCK